VEAADVVRSLGATVLAVNADDAVRAAQMWSATRSAGLSLGDRFCLAVAAGVPNGRAVTADRCWTTVDVGVPVDLIH
jgi:ribonuclease VapC